MAVEVCDKGGMRSEDQVEGQVDVKCRPPRVARVRGLRATSCGGGVTANEANTLMSCLINN